MTGPSFTGDHSLDWAIIAYQVKRAAHNRCERCGAPNTQGSYLTVHHLDGNRANNHPANLVALCQKCHLHVQARFDPSTTFHQDALPGLEEDWMIHRRELYQQCREQMEAT